MSLSDKLDELFLTDKETKLIKRFINKNKNMKKELERKREKIILLKNKEKEFENMILFRLNTILKKLDKLE